MKKPLVMWGGTDINPRIYNQANTLSQTPNNSRDMADMIAIREAFSSNTPVVGVCRSSQLLCAMHGGKLWQHSQPHRQDHSIQCADGSFFERADAGHHQISQPDRTRSEVLAWNPSLTKVWYDAEKTTDVINCAEVVWYPENCCIGIQPHPEWAQDNNDPFVKWINELLNKYGIDYAF